MTNLKQTTFPVSGKSNTTAAPEIIDANLASYDASLPLVGEPCPSCSAPREQGAKFCVSCGTPLETAEANSAAIGSVFTTKTSLPPQSSSASSSSASSSTSNSSTGPANSSLSIPGSAELPNKTFQCQNCGSEVATSVEQRSYICPFCDSSYVTEISYEASGRQRPEFIIGFSITAQEAQQKYFEWLGKNSWFRPGDLARAAVSEKQKGVYLPFWHFSTLATSRWSAQIGEYWYRRETYRTKDSKGKTVTRTREVRETEWFPLNGRHHKYYHGFLVAASNSLSAAEAKSIQPFQLSALARYRPYFLAGWMAEEYSLPMDDAIASTKDEFSSRQEREIKRFLPGDTHSGISVQTQFELNGSDLILLPVHVLSYRYRDRVFRFLVNGQTGKTVGEKPWSGRRIGLVILAAVILLALIVAAISFLSA